MLDEGFRRRVGGLAEVDEGGLDEAARERILELVRVQGPALVRGARRRRVVNGALLFSAAAAVAALFVMRHPAERAGSGAKVASGASNGAGLACSSRSVALSASAGFVANAGGSATPGTARLDLGKVAMATLSPGAVAHLVEALPCRTVIALDSGTVTVHAKDLGGGELRVHAPRGDVVVHGTIFAVTEDAGSLTVEVAVGNVSVTDCDDSHTVIGGQRLLLSKVGAAQGRLTDERARELRALVGAPEVVGFLALPSTQSAVLGVTTPPAAAVPGVTTQPAAPAGAVVAQRGPAPLARAEEPEAAKGSPAVADVKLADEAAPAHAVDPLAAAEQARRAGDYSAARDLYRRAAEGSNVTAEAAWVALARMELSLGHAAQAREATKRRQERFGRGTLGPEALWIDVRSYRQTGDPSKARELANQLVEQWPSSPQARAAQQWLSAR